MKPDFDDLCTAMKDAARATYRGWLERYPEHDFYSISLFTSDCAMGTHLCASSEQSLRRIADEYSAKGFVYPEGDNYLRYTPDEWREFDHMFAIEQWDKAWGVNAAIQDNWSTEYSEYVGGFYETLFRVLRELDAEGLFGTGPERERMTLIIWVTDSFGSDTNRDVSIRELNPECVYRRFATVFPHWDSLGERFLIELDQGSDPAGERCQKLFKRFMTVIAIRGYNLPAFVEKMWTERYADSFGLFDRYTQPQLIEFIERIDQSRPKRK